MYGQVLIENLSLFYMVDGVMRENKHMNGIYINEEDTVTNYLHMLIKSRRVKKTLRHLPL